MPRDLRTITADDILPNVQYYLIRTDQKQEAVERQKLTRMAVGPYVTIRFATRAAMRQQTQEILRI